MQITHGTTETYRSARIKTLTVTMPVTGDESADLATATAAAKAENASASWIGNDYAADGGSARFDYEVR